MGRNDLEPGLVVAQRYRLERPLASHRAGTVHFCQDLATRRPVVLKLLASREPSGAEIQEMRQEFSRICRIKHPALARILDFGLMENSSVPYLIEEYVDGKNILEVTAACERMQVIQWVVDLCGILQHLHWRGMVHGDLRPSNLLVAGSEGNVTLRILDCAIARLRAAGERERGIGMIGYAAPELLLGKCPDFRADLYSLGVLTYQLLSRRLPFEDEDPGFLVQKQMQGFTEIRPIEGSRGAELTQIVRSLLDRDPEKRPQSADEVVRLFSVATGRSHSPAPVHWVESYFSAGRFVGREEEMARLQLRANQVRESKRGFTVFLEGESGVGKTRCMEEFRTWALLAGWSVVEGQCARSDNRAYGPFRQILETTDGPEMTRPPGSPPEETPRIGEAVLGQISETAAGQYRDQLTRDIVRRLSHRPTVVFLHDFHWADEATRTVLDYLSADICACPILLVVSLRDGEARLPLDNLISQTVRQARGEQMALPGLPLDSVLALIESMTGEEELGRILGDWIYRASGGNPFFIEEILKHLVDRGLLRREQAKWRLQQDSLAKFPVPDNIAVVLRHRLKELSASARNLAGWLALFSKGASRDDLIAVFGDPRMETALAELVSRQIVRTSGGESGRIEFCHALISEVIVEDLPPASCRKMHRRIAEMLEEQGGGPSRTQELAVHWIEAGEVEKAIRYSLRAAAECRSEFANDATLRFYEYILARRGDLSTEDLVSVALDAAEAHCALGSPDRALKLLKKELRTPTVRGNPLQKARLHVQLSRAYQFLGNLRLSRKAALSGIAVVENLIPSEKCLKSQLLGQLAFCTISTGRIHEGLELVETALEITSSLDNHLHAGHLFTLKSGLCWAVGKYREGVLSGNRGVRLLEESSSVSLLPIAYTHLGMNLSAVGKLGKGRYYIEKAVELGDRSRSVFLQAQACCNLTEWYCRSGDLRKAKETFKKLQGVIKKISNKMIESSSLLCELEINTSDDAFMTARAIYEKICDIDVGKLPVHARAQAYYHGALLFRNLGQYEKAEGDISKCLKLKPRDKWTFETGLARVLQADVWVQQGRYHDAILLLKKSESEFRHQGMAFHRAQASFIAAGCFLNVGDFESARRYARSALRLGQGMPSIELQAKAHTILGQIASQSISLASSESMDKEMLDFGRCQFSESIKYAEMMPSRLLIGQAHLGCALLEETAGEYNLALIHAQKASELILQNPPYRNKPGGSDAFRVIDHECRQILERLKDHLGNAELSIHKLHADHLRVLIRANVIIGSHRDIGLILEITMDMLIQSMGMGRAFVFLRDSETGKLNLAKGRNMRKETLSSAEALCSSLIEDANLHGMPFITANAKCDSRIQNLQGAVAQNLGAIICAPLRAGGRTTGVLYSDHETPALHLSESCLNLFAAFCSLVAMAVENASAQSKLIREKCELEQYLRDAREGYPEIIGKCPAILEMRARIQQTALSPMDVLIVGESGTGKELVARAIHRTGRRANGPFIAIDCGSLSDSLFESELFGYRKGAFTGANENRSGLLEAANGGVLFLDEISNVAMHLQSKLLRVLQEREFRRIGETTIRKLDAQVVAATNRQLRSEIRRGKFRNDLYYRLNAIEIQVPPLRERREDIQLLIEWYLAKTAQLEGGRTKRLSTEAMEMLRGDPFPGNVRELRNSVQSAYYLTPGSLIQVEHLPADIRLRGRAAEIADLEKITGSELYRRIRKGTGAFEDMVKGPFSERRFGTKIVKEVIERALADSGGKYRDALRLLGVPDEQYTVVMLFLKRKNCYVDYRPFRRKQPDHGDKKN
jgi:transcriptional regulator with GAF, ATPase, and Fis domain/tetratricopeptide (TPR) repeat protein